MPRKIDVKQHVDAQGYPPEVASAVLKSIEESGTASLIESGQSVLPGWDDAVNWHNQNQIRAGLKKINEAPTDTVQHLMDRIAALESASHPVAPPPE